MTLTGLGPGTITKFHSVPLLLYHLHVPGPGIHWSFQIVGAPGVNLLIQFSYLQVLDVLTTMAFLLHGAKEANPVVRLAIRAGGSSPLAGLLALKVFAVLLAFYCVRRARLRLLARVNVFFALLVAWNLTVLIISSPVLAALK